MTNSAPAGWYTDPAHPGFEHWWDGTAYTQSRAVQSVPQPPQSPYAQPQSPYAQAQPVVRYDASYRAVGGPAAAYGSVSPKSRTVASLLSFFLGWLGIDRFYLGNIGMGVAKLLLGWLTAGIWPLVDFIVIVAGSAHDGQGLRVTNWE